MLLLVSRLEEIALKLVFICSFAKELNTLLWMSKLPEGSLRAYQRVTGWSGNVAVYSAIASV
jgi:hypothetical protein